MQDMSPHMEELMRKAAEAYPLKETDDRWDEIALKIDAALVTTQKNGARYKRYVVMLLLLLLFLFTGDYLIHLHPAQKTDLNKQPGYGTKNSGTALKGQANITPIQEVNPVTKKQVVTTNDFSLVNSRPSYKKTILQTTGSNAETIYSAETAVDRAPPFISTERTTDRRSIILRNKTMELKPNEFSFALHNQPLLLSTNSKQQSKEGTKGFYYGVTAGLAFNSVSGQNLKTGWDIGLAGGYYFTNRLSFETGVLLSQKYYWTSGDYFSMEKVGASMPPPMKIMEVDGSSQVIEFPMHVHYSLIRNSRQNLYSSAGFSSYLLTKEYNQYHTSTNGATQMMYGNYKSNQMYFASTLDLAFGYEKNLGRNKSIRLQPYIQLPVKGIGMGNLRVMSTGLSLALVKQSN
jgi:hypothetical protein